ncbi:MAG: protein kinase [Planctomycetes bacterium]|nr:protein kinase [Planctomycetota bacterium]
MGTVFKGYDEALEREVAIKVLSKQLSEDPETVKRFKQEACSAAKVTHPNIVHIYTRGEEDGRSYFVMEYVAGRSLGQEVQEQGRAPVEKAVAWIREAALALKAAHQQGIIHRDIKPSNILLDSCGTVRIADFGLAKVVKADLGLTKTGMVVGTPFYMAPEQGKGGIVDHRADIYALGVTLYHLLVGRVPFDGGTPLEVMLKHVSDPIPVPKDTVLESRRDVRRVVEKMMAKDANDRYANYDDLIAALDGLRPRPLTPASPVSRLVAAAIDFFLIGGIAVPAGVLARFSFGTVITSGRPPFLELSELFLNSMRAMSLLILYLSYAHGRFGQSVGKYLLNLCVVRSDGFPINFKTALGRTLAAYFLVIPIALFGDIPVPRVLLYLLVAVGAAFTFGYLLAAFDPRRRALHDRLCGTVVVYKL